jgi:group I intron endonuclease
MYIYKFTNLINQKCYVGQTIQNPNNRRLEHLSAANNNKKHPLYNSIRKHGIENFSFEIISEAITLEHLNALEEYFINEFDSIRKGYNLREGGNNKKHSNKSILKMQEAQKNAHARRRAEGKDTFVKKNITKGWTHSQESRERRKEWSLISNAHCRGKTWKLINGKRVWIEKENCH